jgi:hypothetical protein
MDQVIYVVEMLRYGDRESHSYVVGVFTSASEAEKCGLYYDYWRGGKYRASISVHTVNYIPKEVVDYVESDCLGGKL